MEPGEHVRSSSHSFACHTPACPNEVWDALTDTCHTRSYLDNLALHSTWKADAAIAADYDGTISLTGQVICSRPGERLSYFLQAASTDPPTYLTWLLRLSPNGTTITLVIDQLESPDTSEDAEDTWLPVLDALQRHLRTKRGRPPAIQSTDAPPTAEGPDQPRGNIVR